MLNASMASVTFDRYEAPRHLARPTGAVAGLIEHPALAARSCVVSCDGGASAAVSV